MSALQSQGEGHLTVPAWAGTSDLDIVTCDGRAAKQEDLQIQNV